MKQRSNEATFDRAAYSIEAEVGSLEFSPVFCHLWPLQHTVEVLLSLMGSSTYKQLLLHSVLHTPQSNSKSAPLFLDLSVHQRLNSRIRKATFEHNVYKNLPLTSLLYFTQALGSSTLSNNLAWNNMMLEVLVVWLRPWHHPSFRASLQDTFSSYALNSIKMWKYSTGNNYRIRKIKTEGRMCVSLAVW